MYSIIMRGKTDLQCRSTVFDEVLAFQFFLGCSEVLICIAPLITDCPCSAQV